MLRGTKGSGADGLFRLISEAIGMRLMHADLDAWRRAFKGLIEAAVFDLASAYAALNVNDAALLVAMHIGITVGAGISGTADSYSQGMTGVVLVI